eukprot:scaffold25800_cov24-Tisochrysis_lutea.AAC.3
MRARSASIPWRNSGRSRAVSSSEARRTSASSSAGRTCTRPRGGSSDGRAARIVECCAPSLHSAVGGAAQSYQSDAGSLPEEIADGGACLVALSGPAGGQKVKSGLGSRSAGEAYIDGCPRSPSTQLGSGRAPARAARPGLKRALHVGVRVKRPPLAIAELDDKVAKQPQEGWEKGGEIMRARGVAGGGGARRHANMLRQLADQVEPVDGGLVNHSHRIEHKEGGEEERERKDLRVVRLVLLHRGEPFGVEEHKGSSILPPRLADHADVDPSRAGLGSRSDAESGRRGGTHSPATATTASGLCTLEREATPSCCSSQ